MLGQVGTTLAHGNNHRFTPCRSENSSVFGEAAFVGLDRDDRQTLAYWLANATGNKIDRVIDLTQRLWKVPGLEVVIGIFETGCPAASWLLVRYELRWVLAQVRDDTTGGEVLEVCSSLIAALELIGAHGSG